MTHHLRCSIPQVPLFHSSEDDLTFDINNVDWMAANNEDEAFFDEKAPPFDLDEFENEALPFEIMSPDEAVVLDEDHENVFNDSNITMTARDARRELNAMQVTIGNQCSRPFLFAIIYYSTSQQQVVHKGWCK